MDEEIKGVGEMATIEDEEDIAIEEDYTTLEAETITIDDDSNIQTDAEYEQAVEQKELADEAREALSAVLLSVLEKGEINDDDIAEIAAQQEIYTENVTALKILGLMTEDEKNTVGKSTTNVITSNIDYNELMKVLSEKADWLYTDENGQVMLNGELVPKLKVVELEAEKVKADVGEFKDLTAENFTAVNAKIDNLEVTDLTAVNADITNLKALVAEIQTLIGGNLTMDNIQSLVLTSDKVTIANALIKNAMIDSISANKINTGTINTNNVSIQSEDGSMVINGTTQQFKDKNNKVRIQIGKDAQGNFTFCLFSQDGVGVLIDESGIKSGAVPNGLIVNDMVSDNANISGGKLDISSVISSINNNENTLSSSKIKFDDTEQTLDIAFNQLKTKVETIENVTIDGDLSSVMEQVSSNTTDISVMQGQISSLISNTTITKQDGTVVQLKDEYNSTKDTVNSHTQTIGSLQTNVNDVISKQTKLEQNLDGFKTTVSNTYATQETTTSMLSQIQQNADNISTKVDVNGVISSINQSSETIAINANKINLNGYVSNDEANWSIDNEGNMNTENMKVEGDISADSLSVNYIDNPSYPATLPGTVHLYVNDDEGNDDYTLDDILQSYDEAEEQGDDTLKRKFKTIQGALNACPAFLNNKEIKITLETDVVGDVYIGAFTGGAIRLYLNGKTLYGHLRGYGTAATIHIVGGVEGATTATQAIIHPSVGYGIGSRCVSVGFEACQFVTLYKLKIFGADNNPSNVSSTSRVAVASCAGTGSVYCSDIEVTNCVVGFRTNNMGNLHGSKTSGIASQYGFESVTGGQISLANAAQAGGTTDNTHKSSGGQIWYDSPTFAAGDTSQTTTTAPSTSTTKTMTIKSTYGDTYRSTVYNNWKKDGTARQGDYGYGDCSGLWFFGTAFSELKGKTISKVELTITRQSGGSYAAVGLVVRTHNYSARPSGAPKLSSSSYGTLSIPTGTTGKLTITDSAVLSGIKNGTIKGFGIRTTYDSAHYAVCSGNVTVKIAYTE